MENKKIKTWMISVAILVIGIIIIIAILALKNAQESSTKENIDVNDVIELFEVFDIDDIKNSKYEVNECKDTVAEQYETETNKYKIDKKVKMQENIGKIIYIRDTNNKKNVYQVECDIEKYSDSNTEVAHIIKNFEEACKSYIGIDSSYTENEKLYGESNEKFTIPVEESIYNEGRLYSKNYKNDNNEYYIDFYKKDNKIICEFTKDLM